MAIRRSWKTTLAGISTLLSVAVKIIMDPSSLTATDIGVIVAGIGLIRAKDDNATHSPNPIGGVK